MEGLQLNGGADNMPVVKAPSNALVFGTLDPQGVIGKATQIANQLAPIVEKAHLFSMISGRKYVKAEGWATMLAMLGIFPATEYSRKLDRQNEIAYESRVILRHISGAEVGAGEAICSSKERNWSNRDEFTIKSMSQTRAFGKAARIGFSFIMSLAGYEPTAFEEMPHEVEEVEPYPNVPDAVPEAPYKGLVKTITEKQRKRLYAIWKQAGKTDEEVKLFLNNEFGYESTKDIEMGNYESICQWAQGGDNEPKN